MKAVVINVESVSKRFYIGQKQAEYKSLRDVLTTAVGAPFRRARTLLQGQAAGAAELRKEFWALKELSFQVERGEIVGIIGPNGAGKSTLLKILTRITEPTSGHAEIRGRVGSLLEVGTGFHPELTGRENVFLNGAILGMRKEEIKRKFDEIVSFAESDEFIDTPVKHYSSGMQMRLAFSVAAHLEPEILLIDEVLAVGDARFQRKCLNQMQEIGKQGRTVLFVSHNLSAIGSLCNRAILIDEGKIVQDGPSHQVVSAYCKSGSTTTAAREWIDSSNAPRGEIAGLRAVRVRDQDGLISDAHDIRHSLTVEMEYEVFKSGWKLLPNFYFWNDEGVCAFGTVDLDPVWRGRPRQAGRYVSTVRIPANLLADGTMFVDAALVTMEPLIIQFTTHSVVAFQVIDSLSGDSARGDFTGRFIGVVRPTLEWDTQVALT